MLMEKTDISSILIIGAGSRSSSGQAAEFDYSGTQAVKVLREEHFRALA